MKINNICKGCALLHNSCKGCYNPIYSGCIYKKDTKKYRNVFIYTSFYTDFCIVKTCLNNADVLQALQDGNAPKNDNIIIRIDSNKNGYTYNDIKKYVDMLPDENKIQF